jgi:hypothetical protein
VRFALFLSLPLLLASCAANPPITPQSIADYVAERQSEGCSVELYEGNFENQDKAEAAVEDAHTRFARPGVESVTGSVALVPSSPDKPGHATAALLVVVCP